MQNIQDLKEKIFFESKNIIDILDKINNVDELLSKQDLVDELANRISFLKLLERNIEYFIPDNISQNIDNQDEVSMIHEEAENQDLGNEVIEEEAIFNNELNEIDENENDFTNHQENESAENENIEISTESESVLVESDYSEDQNTASEIIEEEVLFTNQLNEIDEFENEISDDREAVSNSFEEQEIQERFEQKAEVSPEISEPESLAVLSEDEILEEEFLIEESEEQFISSKFSVEQGEMVTDTSNMENLISEIEDEAQIEEKQEEIILSEENEEQPVSSKFSMGQGEMITDTSNVGGIISEIKDEVRTEKKQAEVILSEENEKRKIVEIENTHDPVERERPASEESFEEQDEYNHEKRIKLSHIKGLKNIQTLFDDDPLERENPIISSSEKTGDAGSLLKANVPTQFMEAEKAKPEFRLDLNDRIAFSKTLFGGSQSELNEVVAELNRFKNLDDAKEYLSELYYAKNWKKVDEYAQRLWLLVENKFL
ncbi:hypothetical protein [Chryseobacterium sp.]|uniref:hypothetical protein n=1 Tax=Chryseobacterium sp. TaxID=1871047 RepID=UPI0025BDEE27|nr:hypothetical protein [Chryseobacterium sp.]